MPAPGDAMPPRPTANSPGSAACGMSRVRSGWSGKGVRFVTTRTDLGFLLAAAGRWTGDPRAALAQPPR